MQDWISSECVRDLTVISLLKTGQTNTIKTRLESLEQNIIQIREDSEKALEGILENMNSNSDEIDTDKIQKILDEITPLTKTISELYILRNKLKEMSITD